MKLSEVAKKNKIAGDVKVAIQLHLFYIDLLDEFLSYFSNIPVKFDLYISCVKGADKEYIASHSKTSLKNVNEVIVKICKNRGRDISPVYVIYRKELQKYDYILHVHSKKSKHIKTGGGDWRVYSLDCLLGSINRVEYILEKFEKEKNIGLIFPDWHPDIPMIGYSWMGNRVGGKELLNRFGIDFKDELFIYPTGSFFWARVDAIKPLFDMKIKYKDFPAEEGQIDGTFAHVLERGISFISKKRGYHNGIIDIENEPLKIDYTDKPFKSNLEETEDMVYNELNQYDTISFSVFDTLVDFLGYDVEDVVELVKAKMHLDDDYVKLRKMAEEVAKSKYGASTSIDLIYDELVNISPFDEEGAHQIKMTELECLCKNVVPREDIRRVYRKLVENGKKVDIICDSYYHTETIESILVKCGYVGYSKVWVSCDYGYSKENEHLWNLVYSENDQSRHIHVGSNVHSDWYTLEKRGAASHFIISSIQKYELHDRNIEYEEIDMKDRIRLGIEVKRKMYPHTFGK